MKGQGHVREFLRWLGAVAMVSDRPISWPRTGSVAAWAIALALVVAAFLAKPALDVLAGAPLPPYITFYGPLIVAALLGGPRIGLAVALVTVILTWFFFMPQFSRFASLDGRSLITVAVYLLVSSFIGWIVGRSRLALDALRQSEEQRRRAARESVHRIKNLIAVVQALVSKISREVDETDEYRDVLSNRLAALATAQDVLVQSKWSDVELSQIIDAALGPFLPNPGLKVRRGAAVLVPAKHVSGLSMALYELCTNSIKYGALAEGRGPVELSWSRQGDKAVLEWTERTPAPVTREEGLGTQLVRYALSRHEGTRVDYIIEGVEVRAVFQWPAAAA
jgi:two-component sensor histidine kinase